MNVCKVPDMCKDMEYKYITEDSKTWTGILVHTILFQGRMEL